jgi:hypothetical protein
MRPFSFNLYSIGVQSDYRRNNRHLVDLVWLRITPDKWNFAMSSRITDQFELIDSATSRSICGAVGERLRRDLGPELSAMPPALAGLLEEMRRREAAADDRTG